MEFFLILEFHETPERSSGLENAARASADMVVISKWVKFPIGVNYPFLKKKSMTVDVRVHVSSERPPPTETCQVNIWRLDVPERAHTRPGRSIHSSQATSRDGDTRSCLRAASEATPYHGSPKAWTPTGGQTTWSVYEQVA